MTLTGELARIDDELRRAYDGDCWHGPPLREVLKGVAAATASAKHPQLVHSIWALVNHLTAWVEVVARRITERRAIGTPDAGDRFQRGGVVGRHRRVGSPAPQAP
jgi:hypothetical protein